MRKTFFGLWSASLLILGCGGGSPESGSDIQGFYSLSLSLDSGLITSPASQLQGGDVTLPPDTISGAVTLTYDGTTSTPMKGWFRKAELCVGGKCYPLGIAGIISAGQSVNFSVSTHAYKYEPPWVVLNPYEDEPFSENLIRDTLSSGTQNDNITDNYYNAQRTVYLPNYPVVAGSLQMSGSGQFRANTIYVGYDSSKGTVNVSLVKGSNTANSIVPNTFSATAGAKTCTDDGAGNIVGVDCSGTIDYTTGNVSIAINNITTPTDINMSYDVNGSQVCWDDGAGNLTGDCNGSISYDTGELIYSTRFDFVSVPVTISISYSYQTGTTDGLTYTYTLPADTLDPNNPAKKIVYGDWIGVYSGSTLLCSIDNADVCTVEKNGRNIVVTFPTPQTAPLTIEYSEVVRYDFNPDVNARDYGHLWNGQGTATVDGEVKVIVELEDGTKLSASASISFYVIPQ